MSDKTTQHILKVEVEIGGPRMEIEAGGIWQTGGVEVQGREIRADGFNLVVDARLPEQVEVVVLRIIRVKR